MENSLYTYETVIIDLGTARNGVESTYSGNFIKAIEATSLNANIDLTFNSFGNDSVNIKKGRAVRANFMRWYLTNTAQAGETITLLIATADSFRIYDDSVVGDIDTIQEIIEPVAVNHLPDKIISNQGLALVYINALTITNVATQASSIYTVPANKIFYLAMLDINTPNFAAGDSPRFWRGYNSGGSPIPHLGDATYVVTASGIFRPGGNIMFNPWVKFTAAETIRLYNSGTCVNAVIGMIFGYLKDA